jgi:hypothetical protein
MADEPGELGLMRVASLAREAADSPVDRETQAAGRVRLLDTAGRITAASRAERSRWTPARVLAAALVLVSVIAVVAFLRYRERPISFEVRGNANASASYVSARDDATAEVRFSDGSDVVAQPGTRLRIEETKSTGARVLVERGATTASVHHRDRTSWAFVAGPFEIRVTGTKLSIAWDPESERIEVTLHEGSVEIETPIGPSRYSVRAGQSFRASVRDGVVKVDDGQKREAVERPQAPPAPPAAEVPAAEPPSAASDIASPGTTKKPLAVEPVPPAEESWTKRVRRGAFSEVVAAAQARGIDDCLTRCSLPDVRALADAARYTGAPELATRALTALRARAKGTEDAATAAFLLGRTAESTGDLAAADRWYSTYSSESKTGTLAAEALAGRMLAASRAGAPARARELAREYLERYPDGAAVRAARRLAGPD